MMMMLFLMHHFFIASGPASSLACSGLAFLRPNIEAKETYYRSKRDLLILEYLRDAGSGD
jgi:hypothetical protein